MNLTKHNVWVVIPFYNEEKLILDVLDALASQYDRDFSIVCVDNNSDDQSRVLVESFRKHHAHIDLHLITEEQKGTGAAVDTGFRYAIEHGAQYVLRTDADAVPCPEWIGLIKNDFSHGKRFIAGRIAPRRDEEIYRWYDGVLGPVLIRLFEKTTRYFFTEPEHKYPIFLASGFNMAIEAQLYCDVNGFPRSAIDKTDEDLELHKKVACVLSRDQVHLNKKAVVYGSVRRLRAMGYVGILLWHWGRKRTLEVVDIR